MAKSSKKAVAKRGSTGMSTVDEQLNAEVTNIADSISAPSGNKIKTQDKAFAFPDGSIENGPVDFVILDYISQNRYYESAWDPQNPAPPECFATGRVVKEMAPSDNSPEAQSENCASCPMNQFGSAGNGKACKNTRLLAVMRADDDPNEGEVYTLSVSPTGLKGFDGYVAGVANTFQAPPVKVITAIDFDSNANYAKLTFNNPRPNPDYAVHFNRRGEAEPMLTVEPDTSNVSAKKGSKKKASRKVARR